MTSTVLSGYRSTCNNEWKKRIRLVFTDELCNQKWLFKFHYSASIFITLLTLKINRHKVAPYCETVYPQDSQYFISYIIFQRTFNWHILYDNIWYKFSIVLSDDQKYCELSNIVQNIDHL